MHSAPHRKQSTRSACTRLLWRCHMPCVCGGVRSLAPPPPPPHPQKHVHMLFLSSSPHAGLCVLLCLILASLFCQASLALFYTPQPAIPTPTLALMPTPPLLIPVKTTSPPPPPPTASPHPPPTCRTGASQRHGECAPTRQMHACQLADLNSRLCTPCLHAMPSNALRPPPPHPTHPQPLAPNLFQALLPCWPRSSPWPPPASWPSRSSSMQAGAAGRHSPPPLPPLAALPEPIMASMVAGAAEPRGAWPTCWRRCFEESTSVQWLGCLQPSSF
jgi:hypothetical protein